MYKRVAGRPRKNASKSTKHMDGIRIGSSTENSRSLSDRVSNTVDDEPEVVMEVFGTATAYVCRGLLLVTPNATVEFEAEVLPILQNLGKNYRKEEAIMFIQENLNKHEIYNIGNLLVIEDEEFWQNTLREMFQVLARELPLLQCKFQISHAGGPEFFKLTRLDAFLLLASMFIAIMPRQSHDQAVTFGELMTFRDKEMPTQVHTRREKLKGYLSYFKTMIDNQQLFTEELRIQRASNRNTDYIKTPKNNQRPQLKKVEINTKKRLQDLSGKTIVANSANRKIGFTALTSGKSQEDKLFCVYPELLTMKLLCEEMKPHEAIVFYGARRFSSYQYTKDQFDFVTPYPIEKQNKIQRSAFVSIDFIRYKNMNLNPFSKPAIFSEINKAYTGFKAASSVLGAKMPVSAGRWGSKRHGGDETLMFLIQWIAASRADCDFVYVASHEQHAREYELLIEELSHLEAIDLLELILEYCEKEQRFQKQWSLLDFIKDNV